MVLCIGDSPEMKLSCKRGLPLGERANNSQLCALTGDGSCYIPEKHNTTQTSDNHIKCCFEWVVFLGCTDYCITLDSTTNEEHNDNNSFYKCILFILS